MNRTTLRTLIISLTLLSISLGGFVFMLFEVAAKAATLTTQITALEAQNTQEASFLALERTAEESRTKREQLARYFLAKESDSIDFLNQVEALAPTVGVSLQTDSLMEVGDKDKKTEWIEVTFSVAGSRERVQQFIMMLEQLPYVSKVMSVDQSLRIDDVWDAKVTMQVRVLSYD